MLPVPGGETVASLDISKMNSGRLDRIMVSFDRRTLHRQTPASFHLLIGARRHRGGSRRAGDGFLERRPKTLIIAADKDDWSGRCCSCNSNRTLKPGVAPSSE